MIVPSGAAMLESVAREGVTTELSKALAKFTKRWADLHIVVLETAGVMRDFLSAEMVRDVIASLDVTAFAGVELVFLVHEDGLHTLWDV